MQLTLFTYPWDIARVGVERYVEEVSALGVTTIAVATVYHSAEVITPRWREDALVVAEPGVAHLPLDGDRFADIAPPVGSLATEDPELFAELHRHASQAGLRMLGWTVALHQTTLASAHPDLTPRTCFGDPIVHGLCPSQPRVRRYVSDLVDAVSATGWFDLLLLESISYIPVGHGHPHELWAARFDPITRALLSLCFCAECMSRGEARGIDTEALRSWVADEVHRGWNGPLSVHRADDTGDEAIGVLLGHEPLLEYVRMRLDCVSDLAALAVDRAHAADVAAWVSSPVWARPLWTSWMQGVDPGRLGFVDGYGLQAYYPEVATVAREIDHALRFLPANKLVLMQTLMRDHHSSSAELLHKLEVARSAGIEEVTLYNYGMASEPVLGWVGEAGRMAKGKT